MISTSPLISEMEKIRVVIADPSPVIQKMYEEIIQDFPDIKIVGKSTNGMEALTLSLNLKPDVLLIYLHLEFFKTRNIINEIQQRIPSITIIGITLTDDPEEKKAWAELGLKCTLVKSDNPEKVYQTICECVTRYNNR